MKYVTRLLLGLAVVLGGYAVLAAVATFSQLADAADRLYAGAGQSVFWLLVVVFGSLVVWPLVLMLRLPRMKRPPKDTSEPGYSRHRAWLCRHLAHHPDTQVRSLALGNDLPGALAHIERQADSLIKRTASGVFVSTALIQNGRLDGLVMLGAQLKLIWQLATLYRLRPTPGQLTYLYGNVAGTMLLSSQLDEVDFAELASPIVASVAPSLATSAPGLQGIGNLLVNSIANGSANAFLTLRVGMMAKAYCAPLIEPEPHEVRSQATKAALALLGTITKEEGARVARGVWNGVKRNAGDALSGTIKGTQQAARDAADAVSGVVSGVVSGTRDTVVKSARVVTSASTQTADAVVTRVSDHGKVFVEGIVDAGQATGKALRGATQRASTLLSSVGIRDKTGGKGTATGTDT